ncbi:MAG: chemotaxis protein CheW [Parasulfuritortus sp.]|jgi:twitching motility protein PilI|nr:chemotaxis protein CheW [Parasulfuritortus sp.]
MDERINLREFQARLADRLKTVAEQPGEASKLGFMAADGYWLVSLDQVSEVVTVPRLARAPWTQSWFLGVAGVRGTIYGCTDLAAFLGLKTGEPRDEIRLLLVNPRFGAHAAFRIDQALGLRTTSGMRRLPAGPAGAPWDVASFEDGDGVIWREISFDRLLAEPRFLQVAA